MLRTRLIAKQRLRSCDGQIQPIYRLFKRVSQRLWQLEQVNTPIKFIVRFHRNFLSKTMIMPQSAHDKLRRAMLSCIAEAKKNCTQSADDRLRRFVATLSGFVKDSDEELSTELFSLLDRTTNRPQQENP
jgi:hypothetical protein